MKERQGSARAKVWWSCIAVASALVGALVLLGVAEERSDAPTTATPKGKAVRVASAERGDLTLTLEYRGELVANAAELAAQSAGRLLEVHKNLGDSVAKGDLLARVDATEGRRLYAEAAAQVQAMAASEQRARAELRIATVESERARRLLNEGLMAEQEATALLARVDVLKAELDTIDAQREAARARSALYQTQVTEARILAPFDGAVAQRYLDPGATVQPGTPVLRIVERGALRVRFKVPEPDLGRVSQGVGFTLQTLATGERSYAGVVQRLSAEVSRTDRTVSVEGVLQEQIPELRPGMYATLKLQSDVLRNRVLIPSTALETHHTSEGIQEHFVYHVDANNIAHRDSVKLQGRSATRVAVAGLDADAQVVVFGQETLSDGTLVRVVSAP